MKDFIQSLFNKYRRKGILVDTNILLLYVVGAVNQDRIVQFKRTRQFTSEDYRTLCKILVQFPKRMTTPNIVTEVNSLVNQLGEPERTRCLSAYGHLLSKFDETYIPSKTVVTNDGFVKFGLTDCGILEIAQDQYLVLTDDFRLSAHLQNQNVDTINFNHLRPYGWN